ncbi:unnamed protein product [Allacma fusca]|uniref:Spondin domain-containing protein n=1 Tax=Allacma fusca TaxID=39272 RepID=A0A8J2LI07_9HEXA|nr:unnamed protein product [Allacma fusca]
MCTFSFPSLFLFCAIFFTSHGRPQCSNEKLVLYQVTLTTFWSRTNFPKQYPEFRPPAQFSKLVGRSHSENFNIFEIGEMASDGLKKFAETGLSDLLDEYSQGASGVLDAFNAPAIGQGVGETETQFFLDSNHSRVSMVIRIIPSPDWFIGVSSLDLCVGNEWIESLAINVTHLCDAGTDSGYTFTAPNFETVPPETITRITSQEPNHKASSFYYPDKESLPTIATVTLSKLKEYSPWKAGDESTMFPSHQLLDDIDSNDIGNEIGDLAEVDGLNSRVVKRRRLRKLKGSRVRDCRVSEWSEWSECSALCGVGVQHRSRYIINHPRGGSSSCPPIADKRLYSFRAVSPRQQENGSKACIMQNDKGQLTISPLPLSSKAMEYLGLVKNAILVKDFVHDY